MRAPPPKGRVVGRAPTNHTATTAMVRLGHWPFSDPNALPSPTSVESPADPTDPTDRSDPSDVDKLDNSAFVTVVSNAPKMKLQVARKFALSLPETTEEPHFEMSSF